MSEIKIDLTLNKSNFCLIAIYLIQFIPTRQPSRQRQFFFRVILLPAWLLSMMMVTTESSLKFHFDKQISRNSQRKNAYRGLRRLDVACNNVMLALLVTSLTLQWRVNMGDVILVKLDKVYPILQQLSYTYRMVSRVFRTPVEGA